MAIPDPCDVPQADIKTRGVRARKREEQRRIERIDDLLDGSDADVAGLEDLRDPFNGITG